MSISSDTIAVIGAGTIGASWAALFLAHGKWIKVYDPSPDAEASVHDLVAQAWPALKSLVGGLPDAPPFTQLSFHSTLEEAVVGCAFIQESTPERLDLKHEVLSRIERGMGLEAVVSSSASGLTLTQMQQGMIQSGRLVLGHPFNPPHLIPLVELYQNELTDDDVLTKAQDFYLSVGKVPIELRREVPGHVANRLQAALWREAIHLITSGVASLADVDKAVSAGPGLRWAVAGPSMIFNLGAGQGGIEAFCEKFGPSFHDWWDDLGDPRLDQATVAKLFQGLREASEGSKISILEERRNKRLLALLDTLDGKFELNDR